MSGILAIQPGMWCEITADPVAPVQLEQFFVNPVLILSRELYAKENVAMCIDQMCQHFTWSESTLLPRSEVVGCLRESAGLQSAGRLWQARVVTVKPNVSVDLSSRVSQRVLHTAVVLREGFLHNHPDMDAQFIKIQPL
jgi:hypothetical protein